MIMSYGRSPLNEIWVGSKVCYWADRLNAQIPHHCLVLPFAL